MTQPSDYNAVTRLINLITLTYIRYFRSTVLHPSFMDALINTESICLIKILLIEDFLMTRI